MQNINAILKVGGTGTAWVTAFGAQVPLPVVTVGIKAALRIDLRGDDPAGSSDLPAYPIEQFAGAASWYFAIDNDYDRDTAPKLLQITGISVASADGATILTAVVPNTAVPGLLEAVGKLKNVTLKSEIGWLDAEGDTIGCIGFDLTITNRVYLPGDIPEEVQNDPEYLTSAQVLAHINAAVADAVAALDVTGEPGPPPTIAVGTVQSGDTAAASLTPVPDTPGAYTLNLTLPRGEEGDAADAPVLTMGTVQSGGTAAATLTPVPDTPGAYTLSLTLPRGIDGSGITPLTGDWNISHAYSLRDAIRHNGAWWYSKSEGNVGHAPPANRQSDAYWQLIVADGEDAEPVLMAFTPDPNEQSAWHLPPYTAGDTHYRFSLDGGATWGVTMPLSMPAASTVILFNQDAESDWADPTAVVGQSYSTVFGKYMRARRAGSSYGEAMAVHDQAPQELRVQFAAAPVSGQEPSWHAALQAGDDRVRIFNAAGSIGPSVFTFALDGLELDSVQFCAFEDPWHTSYVLGDRYRKFSTDGGLTFGQPIPLYGASAYEEWLANGNVGTVDDFFASLKGEPGDVSGVALSDAAPAALAETATPGSAVTAARADHAHPTTGLVKSSEKGAANGVAELGEDRKVPLERLPTILTATEARKIAMLQAIIFG